MDGSTANLLRRFLQRAPDALTDEELLTLLLHAGTGAEEPRTLAARLIGQFGSLGAALSASPEELASVEGMDASRALLLRLVTELHRRYYLSRPFSGARLTGTTDFGNFLLPFFYGAREELVYLLALDAAGRLLTCTCLSEGSVNSANVPMRKLMRAALSANASGVVLAHNHPAGIALPSHEDVELTRRATGRTMYILDEPTTGLHMYDVQKLLDVLQKLVDAGNTVLVIEHNLDVIKCADHIIDLGPEGGDGGGTIVATGTPEDIAACPASFTGQYLKKML